MDLSHIFTTEFFEMCFLLCFFAAWPANIYKSLKSRTALGKSVVFEYLVVAGYIFGIVAKLTDDHISFVLGFYILNLLVVCADIMLYYRNRRLDKMRSDSPSSVSRLK